MTKREKVIARLVAAGCKEVPSKSRKYQTFTRNTNTDACPFWFVGKNGALRTGKTVSGSVSVTHLLKL